MYFSQCWRARHCIVLQKRFMILPFKVTKSHQKAMSKIQTIVCCSKFYQNDFRDKGKAPRREALASYNSSISMKSFKMFIICEICPADHLKVGKKVLQRQFPRYLQFCVIFFYLKFGPMNLFYQQALGGAQILIVQQILGNSI